MISRRLLELLTALLTGAFGAAVAWSSLENGIGWSTEGVDAGTFPFFIGLTIVCGSVVNLARGVMAVPETALSCRTLGRIGALFVPAVLFVGAIPLIGLYLASGGYMFAAVLMQDRASVRRALALALTTPLAIYLVFERMFQVSMPHGALADALGF